MSRLELTEMIGATPARVWRALCDPAEVIAWDAGVAEALDAPQDYPQAGQTVRWLLKEGADLLLDQPFSVITETELGSQLQSGRVHYREIYRLRPADGSCDLRLTLQISVSIPVVGFVADWLWARPQARSSFRESLARLKRHCEAEI